jgi:hypothetical protein
MHKNGLLIPYGSVFSSGAGLLPGIHFAPITSDFERLTETGMRLLREGAKPIRISRY